MDRDVKGLVARRRVRPGRAVLVACALSLGVVALVTCVRQDPIAPDGSMIAVSANPQTVVVQGGVAGQTHITATLRSKNGTRLPDQEVVFSSSAGTLTPPAQTSVITNNQGQATSVLNTTVSATVTAFSGSIMGTTSVNVVSGNLSSVSLDADVQSLSTCTQTVTFTASATDPNNNGVAGLTIVFQTTSIASRNLLQGSFNPTQPKTDVNGDAVSVFTPAQSFCSQNCSPTATPTPPNGGACGIQVVAKDVSGAFVSPPIQVTTAIP
ncbi:MAG: Ig-like domain-containing protein [Acidobacteria bacterium]|nr:Ig-like domain-containing protein [Acidobacteriota bacterium]